MPFRFQIKSKDYLFFKKLFKQLQSVAWTYLPGEGSMWGYQFWLGESSHRQPIVSLRVTTPLVLHPFLVKPPFFEIFPTPLLKIETPLQ